MDQEWSEGRGFLSGSARAVASAAVARPWFSSAAGAQCGACIVGCAELALSQTLPGVFKDCSARNSAAVLMASV